MNAIIFGNGPSLLTAPPAAAGVHKYGVNRAYENRAIDYFVTADARALKAAIVEFDRDLLSFEMIVTCAATRGGKIRMPGPVEIWEKGGTSGEFAMRVCVDRGYQIVMLAGFADMAGNRFYESEDLMLPGRGRSYAQGALQVVQENQHMVWLLWSPEDEKYLDAEMVMTRKLQEAEANLWTGGPGPARNK